MFGQPWYRGYPTHSSYNPYAYPPYQQAPAFDPSPRQSTASYGADDAAQARARALAAQRARRAQYLPDEVEDEDDDWEYDQLGPRERAYLEAQRRRAILERRQQEEAEAQARKRELEEKEWQEALEKRQREDEDARQKLLEERKRQLRLKREEEARLKAAAEQEKMRQKQTQARRDSSQGHVNVHPSTPSHREDTSIPIHVRRDSTSSQPRSPPKPSIFTSDQKPRSSSTSRPPTPKSPTPSKYSLEEQNEAATRIQNQYRIHHSYRTVDDIEKEFETLKKNFVYPRTIDFQKPGGEGHISVLACRPPSDFDSEEIIEPMDIDGPDGKLDFTSANFAVNAYSDVLDKLLMKLDGVESWGKRDIRDKRRTIVKNIEREASKLDRYCKQAWIDYLARQES